jgi:nucleotide-binding universal stress UspA family protein
MVRESIGSSSGAADVLPFVEADLKRTALRVIDKARDLCAAAQVADAEFEALEGDARNVLCDAVERHHAEMLVVGSHGYGAIKRYSLAATPSPLPLLCSVILCSALLSSPVSHPVLHLAIRNNNLS